MATIAKIANGTLLKVGSGASIEVFTTVPEVDRLRGPSIRFDLLDATSHDTVGNFREYIPGMADGDMVSAEMNYRPANAIHASVRADAELATLRNFKMIFPDTSLNTVTMATYIQQFEPEANVAEKLRASVRIKITGAPVWT